MLADQVDVVLGGDTHEATDTIAAVRAFDGAVLAVITIETTSAGYQQALAFADKHAPDRRAWALEGTGCYGAGLVRVLNAHGERVIEIDRPAPLAGSSHAKSDELDAVRAAHTALGRTRHATPRLSPSHDALRVLQGTRESAVVARTAAVNALRALIMTAPDRLRSRLRGRSVAALLKVVPRIRNRTSDAVDDRCTLLAIRQLVDRIRQLTREERLLRKELEALVTSICPALLEEPGVGPISAAQFLISWGHERRFHSEAAFAHAAGAAPIPASSGKTTRYRLNRGGDRKANRALHTVILVRRRHDARTIAFFEAHLKTGKTPREIMRLLKRYLARAIFRLLESTTATTITNAAA